MALQIRSPLLSTTPSRQSRSTAAQPSRPLKPLGHEPAARICGRPPLPDSDLDIYVTLKSEVVNSPEKLQQAIEQIKDVSDLFGRVKTFPVNPVVELDTIAPTHKLQFDKTPFISLGN